MAAFLMLLLCWVFATTSVAASIDVKRAHLPQDPQGAMSPVEYRESNATAYLKSWENRYAVEMISTDEPYDLVSYLFGWWCKDDVDQALMSCKLDGIDDCRMVDIDDLEDDPDKDIRHAVFLQISNWHHVWSMALEANKEHADTLGQEFPELAKQFSYTDDIDAYRKEEARKAAELAHIVNMIQMLCFGILAGVTPILTPATAGLFAVEASTIPAWVAPTIGTTISSMSTAWSGATTVMMDEYVRNEARHPELVVDAAYDYAQTNNIYRRTIEKNYQHLLHGGKIGNVHSLSDFLQFGTLLQDPNSMKIKELMYTQLSSMAVDRIWKEDRPYILQYQYSGIGLCLYETNLQLKTSNGDIVKDSRMVCLPERPDDMFFVFSWPKDPDATKAVTVDLHPEWYHEFGRIRPVPGGDEFGVLSGAEIQGSWRGINWLHVVRSSLQVHEANAQNNGDIFEHVLQSQDRNFAGPRFTLPICLNPTIEARAAYNTMMPMGMPLMCGARNADDINRFLTEMGIPSQYDKWHPENAKAPTWFVHDHKYGTSVPDTDPPGDTELSYGDRGDMNGLINCKYRELEGKQVEECVNVDGPKWNIPNSRPNPCGDEPIPRDVYDIPTILLDRHGCAMHDNDGNTIPYNDDDFCAPRKP